MMNRTGAVWLFFVAGLFVAGAWIGDAGTAWGQDEVSPATLGGRVETLAESDASSDEAQTDSAVATAETKEVPAALSPREKTRLRMEAIRDLPVTELKEKLAETEALLPTLNQQLGEAGRAAQETRESAAADSPEIRELYLQIRALHERIAALTETLPEVQEKVAEQTAIRGNLLGEMDFRTQLMNLIRQKEAAEAAASDAKELP